LFFIGAPFILCRVRGETLNQSCVKCLIRYSWNWNWRCLCRCVY